MKMQTSFFFMIAYFSLISCNDSKDEKKIWEEKVVTIQNYYKNKIKENYSINNSSASKEAAIKIFLNEIAQADPKEQNLRYACDKEETTEILLPNTYDSGTITSLEEPEKAWQIIKIRRDIGIDSLFRKLNGKKISDVEIAWKDKTRDLHSLVGHFPAKIYAKINNSQVEVEEIKLVIQNSNQFKVCILSR